MAEFLGLGLTHYPLPAARPDRRARGPVAAQVTDDPDIPAKRKDPASWPPRMRHEWGEGKGVAAAARHRAELREESVFQLAALAGSSQRPTRVLPWSPPPAARTRS
jgi:hypothetical protein